MTKGGRKINRWKRQLGIGILAGIIMFMMGTSSVLVQASSILEEVTETTADYAEDTNYSLLRGAHLNLGTVKIQKIASNEIAIYGLTQ